MIGTNQMSGCYSSRALCRLDGIDLMAEPIDHLCQLFNLLLDAGNLIVGFSNRSATGSILIRGPPVTTKWVRTAGQGFKSIRILMDEC